MNKPYICTHLSEPPLCGCVDERCGGGLKSWWIIYNQGQIWIHGLRWTVHLSEGLAPVFSSSCGLMWNTCSHSDQRKPNRCPASSRESPHTFFRVPVATSDLDVPETHALGASSPYAPTTPTESSLHCQRFSPSLSRLHQSKNRQKWRGFVAFVPFLSFEKVSDFVSI